MSKNKTLLPVSEIGRRANRCPETVLAKLHDAGIEADFEQVAGSRRSPLFLESRMGELKRAILSPEVTL
jgi:hypothetical protein